MRKKQIYSIKFLRSKGYPYKIKGNDGYVAVLCDIQPLLDGDYEAVYRYPGGDAVHDLDAVKGFEVVEW